MRAALVAGSVATARGRVALKNAVPQRSCWRCSIALRRAAAAVRLGRASGGVTVPMTGGYDLDEDAGSGKRTSGATLRPTGRVALILVEVALVEGHLRFHKKAACHIYAT
ncbi:hypothetical protein NDU88_006159 [Pleurodeles waltl]|uniref:Uncharacterized protein n=1 Tax=Pleurodeles waltl TaxID=8319 RepID=A0AAV7UN55_PLEWA|nr:hypothetical protein NDU88_006159 [Pleurodeles waltl]